MKTGFWAFLGALIGTQGKKLQGTAGTILFFMVVAFMAIPVWIRWTIGAALVALILWQLYVSGAKLFGKWSKKHPRGGKRKKTRGRVASEELGAVYVFRDSYGMVRYDGSSGDLDTMLERIKAHAEDKTALADLIKPGWTLEVEWVQGRENAYAIEGERIDERFGEPGYENRRREGRGR